MFHIVTVSIVVPIFNEIESVGVLFIEICRAMDQTNWLYEIVFVDDGSTDGTRAKLQELAADPRISLVLFRRNYGQSAAIHAGIQHATGGYIVTMDGDLQDDPIDIPRMLGLLEEGYGLIHGWRKYRKGKLRSRLIPSQVASWLISRVTPFPVNDIGCSLNAMSAEVGKELELYGEMHCFIPVLASMNGAECAEIVVSHRPRQFGNSKFGISRMLRAFLDLITIRYMQKHFSSPMKLFGTIGFWVGAIAMVSFSTSAAMKFGWGFDLTGNPLLLIGILFALLSAQFFSVGLIGELSVRIYYAISGKRNYQVESVTKMFRRP